MLCPNRINWLELMKGKVLHCIAAPRLIRNPSITGHFRIVTATVMVITTFSSQVCFIFAKIILLKAAYTQNKHQNVWNIV